MSRCPSFGAGDIAQALAHSVRVHEVPHVVGHGEVGVPVLRVHLEGVARHLRAAASLDVDAAA